ncbi:MAG TPA: insulinase family protein, partial [Gemmatimonadaceae bacterium]|nr:insulinase family protein [Gemmatimonadaceae bacterium]
MIHQRFHAAAIGAVALLAATAATPAPAFAQTKTTASHDILPFKATERTLANGLKVIIVPTGFPNIVSIQVPVQTGSRNEVEPGKSGFAHFFEHIMSRGTKTKTPEQMNEIITRAGARENAYTTDDYTNYYATFAKEDLEAMLALQADRFQNLSYDEAAFKTESRAILGEYNKNSADPSEKLFEAIRDSAFTTHTYKHTTMGFIKDIEDMPNQYTYSKQFFDRWYRPENATIIVAGDVTPAEVMPLVQKYYGNWKRGSYKAVIPVEPPSRAPKYAHVDWSSPTLPYLSISFHNPAFSETNNDNAALDFVANLWFGPTSEIYKKLVQREQKVDGLSASNTSNADPELFSVFTRVKKPEDVVYVRDEILKTIAQARTTLVSASELADSKSNERYSFVRTLDNTDRIASTLARYVRYSRSYNTLNRAYALYDAVTPADLRRTAAKYFTDNEMIVATLSSSPLSAAVSMLPKISSFEPAVATGKKVMTPPSKPTDTAPWMIDASHLATSGGSGVVAPGNLIVQKTPLQQIRVKLLFNVGSASDPAGKEGLAALSARMITAAGSRTMMLEQISKALYPVAGGFGSQVDKEMTTFSGGIHKDNWARFLAVALPMLVDPGFREEDFRRNRDGLLNSLTLDLRSNND